MTLVFTFIVMIFTDLGKYLQIWQWHAISMLMLYVCYLIMLYFQYSENINLTQIGVSLLISWVSVWHWYCKVKTDHFLNDWKLELHFNIIIQRAWINDASCVRQCITSYLMQSVKVGYYPPHWFLCNCTLDFLIV